MRTCAFVACLTLLFWLPDCASVVTEPSFEVKTEQTQDATKETTGTEPSIEQPTTDQQQPDAAQEVPTPTDVAGENTPDQSVTELVTEEAPTETTPDTPVNPNLPKLSLRLSASTLTEGQPGDPSSSKTPTFVTVTVTSSAPFAAALPLQLAYTGDAVLYQDVDPEHPTLILLKGQTTASMKLYIVRDRVKEKNKTLTLSLTPQAGRFAMGAPQSLTIEDDDSASSATTDGCFCKSGADERVLCSASSLTYTVKSNNANGSNETDATFTWAFSSQGEVVYCGRFINGDLWLAARDGQALQITSLKGNRAGIGAELDPRDRSKAAGFGADNPHGNYDASKDIATKLPFTIPTTRNHIILAGLQRQKGCGTKSLQGKCVDIYQFLTILQRAPEGQGRRLLRPALTSNMKLLLHFDRDFNWSRLKTDPGLQDKYYNQGMLSTIRRTWNGVTELFNSVSEGGRGFRAHMLIDDYASGMATVFYTHTAYMMAPRFTLKEKEQALASMLVFGQDNYYIFHHKEGPRYAFGGGAGQNSGKILPVTFFGMLRSDPSVAADIATIATESHGRQPQEFKQLKTSIHGEPIWGDGAPFKLSSKSAFQLLERRYWSELYSYKCYDGAITRGSRTPDEVCKSSSGGKRTAHDPYLQVDGPGGWPGYAYFGANAGLYASFAALLYFHSQLCDVTNYDAIARFANRVAIERRVIVGPDHCAPPDPREAGNCSPYYDGTATKTNCVYYGVTWGPDRNKPGDCIRNNTGGNKGQTGRFSKFPPKVYDKAPTNLSKPAPGIGYKSYLLLGFLQSNAKGRKTCRTHAANATLTTTAATKDASSTWLTWSHPASWSDGTKFDPSIHLGRYQAAYRLKDADPWKPLLVYQTTASLAGVPASAKIKLEACDFMNVCTSIPIK